MGGWYKPRGLFRSEELGGLSCADFCAAVSAEGCPLCPDEHFPLHLHPLPIRGDLFRQGKPTALAFGQRDVRQGPGSLPVSERIREISVCVPGFKRDRPEAIRAYAEIIRRVSRRFV